MPTLSDPALAEGRAGAVPRRADAAVWRAADVACADLPGPLAILDLEALSFNAGSLLRRAAGKPIRVASKSIRNRDVLRTVLAVDGFAGVLAFTLPEALWLAADDAFTDVVVGYPTADGPALRALAADPVASARVTLMVDSAEQLDWIEYALDGVTPAGPLRVALELDASWRPTVAGRPLAHIGVRRSPVRTPGQAAALARDITARRPGGRPLLHLVGMMAYEAQVAGLQDTPWAGRRPVNAAKSAVLKRIQASSMEELRARRRAAVAAVRAVVDLQFVNGGGTGSLELTTTDPSVTELAAGSGLFGPTLFDGYSRFSPQHAVGFALPVVRRPHQDMVTLLGGGWIASGPPGPDRAPVPVHPAGLSLVGAEGAGEVQTPVRGPAARSLHIGDKVWFRHAKSGEVCEHVEALEMVDGGTRVGRALTYRGEGKVFL
ncbi:alanine racemase [Specibacter cremeus]|uniref:alanine racemase n=1 Tax=Specibacter cremeus TaxID=1629051 RepID=UPI000F793883|nr:alanine racemase [Specibacter cremeus]